MHAGPSLKVMQITHDLNIGGLQRLVVEISKNLHAAGYAASVCSLRGGGAFEGELRDEGINVIKLPNASGRPDYFTFWKLYRLFRAYQPDIIHTHNTQPFLEGGIAARMAGVPVIIHTDHGREFPDKRRYMFAEWVMAHFIDQVVAVSDAVKRDLCRFEKISERKIRTIVNGIDGEKFGQTYDRELKKRELGINGTHVIVAGYAGRLSAEKGLVHLIGAMKMLTREFPNALLLIAGDGQLREELENDAARRGLKQNIRFLGPRADIHEIMGLLDIFVLPSLREGLPLVLLEAAAASLPIIATDVGGNNSIVKNGVNGLLVRPGDDAALWRALKELAWDALRRQTFGKSSLRLFHEGFSASAMMREYKQLYHDCLSTKGRA